MWQGVLVGWLFFRDFCIIISLMDKIKIPDVQFDHWTKKLLFGVNAVILMMVVGAVVIASASRKASTTIQQVTKHSDDSKTTRLSIVADDKIKLNQKSWHFMSELANQNEMTGELVSANNLDFKNLKFKSANSQYGFNINRADGFFYVYKKDLKANSDQKTWDEFIESIKSKGYKIENEGSTKTQFDDDAIACWANKKLETDTVSAQPKVYIKEYSILCLDRSYLDGITAFYAPIIQAMSADKTASHEYRQDAEIMVNQLTVAPSLTKDFFTFELQLAHSNSRHYMYKIPSGQWKYFKSAQSATLPCADYNTAEIKKAYAGVRCQDGKENVALGAK